MCEMCNKFKKTIEEKTKVYKALIVISRRANNEWKEYKEAELKKIELLQSG